MGMIKTLRLKTKRQFWFCLSLGGVIAISSVMGNYIASATNNHWWILLGLIIFAWSVLVVIYYALMNDFPGMIKILIPKWQDH